MRGRYGYPQVNPFSPTFHAGRLKEVTPGQKPMKIFVSSMGDLFGNWVPNEWIEAVLEVVRACPQHTFQFLTKNPVRYRDFEWPENAWLGATVTNSDQADAAYEAWRDTYPKSVFFISYEPLLMGLHVDPLVDWVIIGEQTGPGPKPSINAVFDWTVRLIWDCQERKVPVLVKAPLRDRLPKELQLMQWPKKGR